MNSFLVMILDPRGVVPAGKNDVIERHSHYGKILARQNNKVIYKLKVVTASTTQISASKNSKNFEIVKISKPTFNSYQFAKKAHKFIKINNLNVELLIAGDPWESFWSAYFLNKLLNKKIPIQIQVHGDIADPRWRRINSRNRIRYFLAKLAFPKAASIRSVTKYQAENLVNSFGIKRQKIVIVPVPVNVLGYSVNFKLERPQSIGLIGRIHPDRGIWEFIRLVRALNLGSQDFKIFIIGEGPSRDQFLLQLGSAIKKNKIIYRGQLPQAELQKIWKGIGVLVSMAPVESYGRVMREALVAGVPVWARSSSGVMDLMDKCEKGTVKIIDLNKSASELSKDFEVLLKTKVGPKFAKAFIKENETYAEKLAESWIKTINKSKKGEAPT